VYGGNRKGQDPESVSVSIPSISTEKPPKLFVYIEECEINGNVDG